MATLSLARYDWPGIYDVYPVLSWSFSTNDAKDSNLLGPSWGEAMIISRVGLVEQQK
jgi:hypothetical protein